jgi:initiation factor 1A
MPNQKGGKKYKRKAKTNETRQLVLREKDQSELYAQIKTINGSGRYSAYCFDGQERTACMRGKIRKYRVSIGDIVLVSLWTDLQDDKCSIIHVYDEGEARKLESQGEFPSTFKSFTDNPFEDDTTDTYHSLGDMGSDPDMPSDSSDTTEESEEDDINMDDI